MKIHNLGPEGSPTVAYHTIKEVKYTSNDTVPLIDSCVLTGCCQGLEVGDKMMLDPRNTLTVDKIIEQRDHKGFFKNKKDAKDAYFKVQLIR